MTGPVWKSRAAEEVPLLEVLYRLCLPVAKLFISIGVSANMVTTLSNIFALTAILSLIKLSNHWVFPILWFVSMLLDLCDGMVARLSGSASHTGNFYDKVSDQVKIIGVFLAIGIRYSDMVIWIAIFVVNSVWLLYTSLRMTLQYYQLRLRPEPGSEMPVSSTAGSFISKAGPLSKLLWFIYSAIFLTYGNVFLWFLPASFGKEYAWFSVALLFVVFSKCLARTIISNMKINRTADRQNLSAH